MSHIWDTVREEVTVALAQEPAQPSRSASTPGARGALDILQYLGVQQAPVSAASIARTLGLARSTVYRLLTALEDAGFAIHYPESRRYGIGVAAFELSAGFSRQAPLSRLGAPVLASLVDRVGESGHLAVLHGRDVLYLSEERAPRRPSLVTDVGVRLPAHLTASGRAMLAALPKAQLRALFPDHTAFAQRGHAEISTYRQLTRLLVDIRAAGYAAEDGEVTEGLASVAVALRDPTGWPAASIAVTFASATAEDRVAEITVAVRAAVDELARRMHGRRVR